MQFNLPGSRAIQDDEFLRLLEATRENEKYYLLFLLARLTGMRISEIRLLRFKHITKDYIIIPALKGSNPRVFETPDLIREYFFKESGPDVLKVYKKQGLIKKGHREKFIFLSRNQKKYRKGFRPGNIPLTARSISKMFKTFVNFAQIMSYINENLSFHAFRKAFVKDIWKICKGDIYKTMEYTGHKDPKSLLHYLRNSNVKSLNKISEKFSKLKGA